MMRWTKLGTVWNPEGDLWWARSHATCPTPVALDRDTIRIFIQCRDSNNVGRVGYVDVAADNPLVIRKTATGPVLDIGQPGTFDDNGVLQTTVIPVNDKTLYMYYVGFELSTHIRYKLLGGLAISNDGGNSFERIKKVPVLERSDEELYFRGGPFVLHEEKVFRMWYVAGSEWTEIQGKPMPVYSLRYMESSNGIDWPTHGTSCLEVDNYDEYGFGRPYVIHENDNFYRLFYSIRRISFAQYRMGYAESVDGINWERKDDLLNFDVSPEGWDSQAIEYAAIIRAKQKTYMFYNGNNFGETGFGVALLQE